MVTRTFDELLTHLGTGWWNVLYIATLCFRLLLQPSQTLNGVYLAPWQDHTCRPQPAHVNITMSRHACHYVIERLVKEGGDGGGDARVTVEEVDVPCTQWDYNTSTFTSTLTSDFGWVCGKEHLRADYQSVYIVSTVVTSLLSGFLADRFGRLKVLVASHVALSAASFALCFLHNVPIIFFFRFFTGCSDILTGFVLTLEVCKPKHRAAVGVLSGLAWSLGTAFWGCLAYFVRSWRPLQLAAALPTFFAFPLLYFMDESPRWLIVRGHTERARRVLKKAARWNKKTLPPDDQLDDLFARIRNEETQRKMNANKGVDATSRKGVRKPRLFRDKNIATVTIINSLCYFCVALVFDGLNLAGDLYSDNLYIYLILAGLVEMPGIIFATPLIHHVGRKRPLVACLLGCGIVNISLCFIPAEKSILLFVAAMVGKLLVCAAFQIIYVFSSELFPTEVRGSGVEGASAMGQIGAILAPYFSTYLGPLIPWLPSAVYGVISIVTAFAALLLRETKDKPLPDTIADLRGSVTKQCKRERKSATAASEEIETGSLTAAFSREQNTAESRVRNAEKTSAEEINA